MLKSNWLLSENALKNNLQRFRERQIEERTKLNREGERECFCKYYHVWEVRLWGDGRSWGRDLASLIPRPLVLFFFSSVIVNYFLLKESAGKMWKIRGTNLYLQFKFWVLSA